MRAFTLLALIYAVTADKTASVSKNAVSPVAKVVELLQAMQHTLEGEGKEEMKLYTNLVLWSGNEKSNSKATIVNKKAEIEDAEAFIEDQKTFRETLSAAVDETIGEIARLEAEKQNATDIRNNEKKVFVKTDEERASAINQIGIALDTLEKNPTFLQANVVERIKQSAALRSEMVSELVEQAGSRDDIIEILRNMEEATTKDRNDGMSDEQEGAHAFDMLSMSLNEELESENDLKSSKQAEISASEEQSSQKSQELMTAKKVLEETEVYLANIQAEFKAKTAEHKANLEGRSDTVTAIQEAVQILTSARAMAVFSGGQLAASVAKLILVEPKVDAAVDFVQVESAATQHGPFDKVKTMVSGMIGKLQKEANEAADHHAFCEEEMGKTQKSMAEKNKEVAKLTGRLEAREASIEEMTTRKADCEREMTEMQQAVASATDMRIEERAAAMKAISEYKDGGTILSSAMQVLSEVFAEKATTGNQIIGILEVAVSDFAKLKLEAESQESAAEADFKKLNSEAKVRQAALKTELEGLTRMSLATQSDVQHMLRELESVKAEVTAVTEYWEQLKPQCTVKIPTHEERQERRANQIEGLNNALGVLSGNAVP